MSWLGKVFGTAASVATGGESEAVKGAVTGVFDGLGSFANDIREAITGKLSPEKEAEIDQKLRDLTAKADDAQMQVNLAEAKSESIFVAGWRPFVGWICGLSLFYASVFEPLISWCAKVFWGYAGTFPTLNTDVTMQVLFGMLGLGVMRTVDKIKAPGAKGGV